MRFFRAKRYKFQVRGKLGDTRPALGIRIGPLILFGVWHHKRNKQTLAALSRDA